MIFLHDLLLVFSFLKLFNIIPSKPSLVNSGVVLRQTKLTVPRYEAVTFISVFLRILFGSANSFISYRGNFNYKDLSEGGKESSYYSFPFKTFGPVFFCNFRKKQFILFLILDSCYRFPADGLDLIAVSWL